MRICIFMKHVYIRIGIHTCITYIHAHVHTHIHTYIHTRIHRHIHTQYYIHCMHYIDTYIAYITDITSMHTFHTSHYIHCTHTLYKLHYITLPTFQTNIVRITYIFDQLWGTILARFRVPFGSLLVHFQVVFCVCVCVALRTLF